METITTRERLSSLCKGLTEKLTAMIEGLGPEDRSSLRQITGAMKDILEIQAEQSAVSGGVVLLPEVEAVGTENPNP